jgi:hypothetical protein
VHAAAAVALVLTLGACQNSQDPGIKSPSTPSTKGTPNTLGPCPKDSSKPIPTAGCLDPNGTVIYPHT